MFNFESGLEEGVTLKKARTGATRLPSEGIHEARISSIIGLGMIESFYEGTSKGFVPKVTVIFELKEEADLEDGMPLTIDKDLNLQHGDKSNFGILVRSFLADDGSQATCLEDLIGAVGNVNISHSACGKYANITPFNMGGVSPIAEKYRAKVPKLCGESVGHVPFHKMTESALFMLHPIRHVAMQIINASNYPNSVACSLITEIRKRPNMESYGTLDKVKKQELPTQKQAPVVSNLDETTEY